MASICRLSQKNATATTKSSTADKPAGSQIVQACWRMRLESHAAAAIDPKPTGVGVAMPLPSSNSGGGQSASRRPAFNQSFRSVIAASGPTCLLQALGPHQTARLSSCEYTAACNGLGESGPARSHVQLGRHLDHGSTKSCAREQALRTFIPLRCRQHDPRRASRFEECQRLAQQRSADAAAAMGRIDDEVVQDAGGARSDIQSSASTPASL